MTSEEREKLKKKLSREITETKETIENLEEATQPISPDNAIGRISRMEAINSKSVNEAALDGAVGGSAGDVESDTRLFRHHDHIGVFGLDRARDGRPGRRGGPGQRGMGARRESIPGCAPRGRAAPRRARRGGAGRGCAWRCLSRWSRPRQEERVRVR